MEGIAPHCRRAAAAIYGIVAVVPIVSVVRTCSGVTSRGRELCGVAGGLEAVEDDVEHLGVTSQRVAKCELHGGKFGRQIGTEPRQVFRDMSAGRQEVGHDEDPLGTAVDTTAAAIGDRGLAQFQIAYLDNRVIPLR